MSATALPVPYGTERLTVPRSPFVLEPLVPPGPSKPPMGDAELREAFRRPVASPSLEEIFHGARSVLVVVPDGTRSAGTDRYLPALVERIERCCKATIALAVATGIHRSATREEIERTVGHDLAARLPVLAHDPDDPSRLADLGRTASGTPVKVNAAIREHDRIVLTGGVGFHYYAGFSGGRKALVPGLASRETVTRNHLRALRADGSRHPAARAGRLDGNPVHRDMVEGAALVGPHLLVNAVPGEEGIERLFVGHWRRAHESACRYVRATRSVRVAPRDLVVASAGGEPTDLNLIQSHKAFEAGIGALRPGGVFVLVARCREGAGHEDFLPFLRHEREEEMVRELREDFRVYRQTALSWFRKASAHRLILVSGLPREVARLLRAEPAADLEEAFRLASRSLPARADGWLLSNGGRLLVEASA